MGHEKMDRRSFLTTSISGITCLSLPPFLDIPLDWGFGETTGQEEGITSVVREPTLFAGIRKPIQSREDLVPRIRQVREACGDRHRRPSDPHLPLRHSGGGLRLGDRLPCG